nr:reverse transcriptase domain-containing protein [Tanacetum cinerariifolium]
MKGAPECMRIFGFMHGVNNPKLTKRLNEHVSKTMEEMMITTTAFIRGEAVVATKKKGHTSWRTQDQSKRKTSKKMSDFRGHSKEGSGSSRFTPLTRTPKEILTAEAGDADHSTRAWMNFMIVRLLAPYNGMIERPEIKEIQTGPSTTYEMLKFLIDGGIVTIRSTILIPAACATVITSSEVPKETGVRHENFKVTLHPNFPYQEVEVEGTLTAKGRTKLCSLLKENLDIFAWQPSDMTGVPRSIIEHRLNIREGYSPVRQKKR